MRRATFLIALVALSLAFQGLAAAAGSRWTPFGTAHWEKGAGLGGGYGLVTTSSPSGTYGGIQLSNPPSDPSSIGRAASHGCIHVRNAAMLRLFARTPAGTPVLIRA